MGITIRPIERGDLAAVVELIRELAVHHDLLPYFEVDVQKLATAMYGANAMLEGLIALDGDTAAGYALFFPHFSSFRGQTGLYLEDLYVTERYRGTGIGERLMAETALVACKRGYSRLDLLVDKENTAAIGFYERLGADSNVDDRHFRITGDAFRQLAARAET